MEYSCSGKRPNNKLTATMHDVFAASQVVSSLISCAGSGAFNVSVFMSGSWRFSTHEHDGTHHPDLAFFVSSFLFL
eukprot:111905-Amphidinium_carterae.1